MPAVFLVLIILSCAKTSGDDKENSYFGKPAGYEEPSNAGVLYPLFVYLHGSGAKDGETALPCLKNSNDQNRYPSFVYVPFTEKTFDNKKIISQIEQFKREYRIDPDRLYLMGYSLGGSGAYSLANAYWKTKRQLFAAIVRMAGQSGTSLDNAIAAKTAVWYHVGLSDESRRVRIARKAWAFLKNHPEYASAAEKSSPVQLDDYPGITMTLVKNGQERIKYTEYAAPTGHGISSIPLEDPGLLSWIFSQSLK